MVKRIIALGFFDGLHRGHATLMERAKERAAELGASPAVMTFDTHPDELISHTRGYGKGQEPEDYLESFGEFVRSNVNEINIRIIQHFFIIRINPFNSSPFSEFLPFFICSGIYRKDLCIPVFLYRF